ncbi:MAG: bifunctional phosphoribosylaminoimidazolecarboxamide formyltransferase/IMP cyclohydrolase [Planctomycetales bacterium]|nr:bifunctional phosphoribosylaminoimidazolecarboxamide formyltransferase/IMP cyclohydrolase [Planctomycetales bacterium]
MTTIPLTSALISVSDKTGLIDFAQGLAACGVTIYSTGGTRKHLENAGVAVRDISEYTGFPEMMDGRLKTLHPKVFGGILCRHDREDDMAGLAEHGIEKFELVVVNLYPFEATIAKEGVTPAQAIEQIDIGGPSLVRAAAKNHAFTAIATDSSQYAGILAQVQSVGGTDLAKRKQLAAAAFAVTADYDRAIADWFARQEEPTSFPPVLRQRLDRKAVLRYGENPHQQAALYAERNFTGASLVNARQLNGKELSYNNLLDLDAALAIARSLPGAGAAVLKHNNPCGAASAESLAEATVKAMAGDPVSAFGSVIGFNRTVDAATAEVLAAPGNFVEAIVAPGFDEAAIEVLTTKPKWKANVRLMAVGQLDAPAALWQTRWIEGGLLVQNTDFADDPRGDWKVVTARQPTDAEMAELAFAWAVVRHVKSNAIVLCRDQALCGAGAGQMSRVDSVEIAISKAGERAAGCVLASDAFFPFPDSIHRAAAAGVKAVIEPGGSVKDDEVIAACDEHGLAMVFTGRRHFKH